MSAGNRNSSREDRPCQASGLDLDVWGRDMATQAMELPVPGTDSDCIRKVDGACPPGCRLCVDFAEEMSQLQRTQETEDTDGDL